MNTPVKSADGREFVLFHEQELTAAELALLQNLRGDELLYLLDQCGSFICTKGETP